MNDDLYDASFDMMGPQCQALAHKGTMRCKMRSTWVEWREDTKRLAFVCALHSRECTPSYPVVDEIRDVKTLDTETLNAAHELMLEVCADLDAPFDNSGKYATEMALLAAIADEFAVRTGAARREVVAL